MFVHPWSSSTTWTATTDSPAPSPALSLAPGPAPGPGPGPGAKKRKKRAKDQRGGSTSASTNSDEGGKTTQSVQSVQEALVSIGRLNSQIARRTSAQLEDLAKARHSAQATPATPGGTQATADSRGGDREPDREPRVEVIAPVAFALGESLI